MSSAIYAHKMLLLQTQLDVDAEILQDLEPFDYFVADIYEKHRFKAPVGAKAAANDLQVYKLLLPHERIPVFKDISDAALSVSKKTSLVFERRANPICCVLTNCRSTPNKICLLSYFVFTKDFQRQT